jgi:hypothetical protein
MQRLIPLVLLILSLNNGAALAIQTSKSPVSLADDHAIIQRRRIVIVRSAELVKQFPGKARATVTYPVISGLSPAILRRVRGLLDFKNIFDYSLKEYREDTWLFEFTYKVNHNADHLLDITFTQDGSAAYPDTQDKHFLINLKDGRIVKAPDAFHSNKFAQLAAAVDRKLQDELKRIDKENTDPSEQPEDRTNRREAYEGLKFEPENLDDFSVGRKGITFLYDAGFPHVIRALEPDGRYFFTYVELKPFIKPDGPLGQFVR